MTAVVVTLNPFMVQIGNSVRVGNAHKTIDEISGGFEREMVSVPVSLA